MKPIHFFTIVLNGMPFIEYHIKMLQALTVPWHWHIIEGVADLKHDTGWGLCKGACIPDKFHKLGKSVDGTLEYIFELRANHRASITLYEKPEGIFWDGKIEMINSPLFHIKEEVLLWQLDSDELWKPEDVQKVYEMFGEYPERFMAYFYCYYFVGPRKYIETIGVKSTRPDDWLRVWRFKPGMVWKKHEPPILSGQIGKPYFTIQDTLRNEISFQHFAYATRESIRFKEDYYGYGGLVKLWDILQSMRGKVMVGNIPGIEDGTIVNDWNEEVNGELLWTV
jgi:hypothetical protein